MPSTKEFVSSNVYRFPGENTHLALQANEVAWTGQAKRSGWIIVAIASVVVLVGLVAIGNGHG